MIEHSLNGVLMMLFAYIIWIDCKKKKIYNKTLICLLLCLLSRAIYLNYSIKNISLSLLINVGVFLSIYILSKNLGAGDVKLAMVLSLYCVYPNCIMAIYLSWIFGGLVAVIYLVVFRKHNNKYIPFAPMLLIGNYLADNYFSTILKYWYEVMS